MNGFTTLYKVLLYHGEFPDPMSCHHHSYHELYDISHSSVSEHSCTNMI